MALKYDKRCRVCQALRQPGSEELLRRIQKSRAYEYGGESIQSIGNDYKDKFNVQSLYLHVKKHQGLNAQELADRRNKSLQKRIQRSQISEAIKHTEVVDDILELGQKGLKEGEIKLTGANLVQAARLKSDIEQKQLDRQMEFMKMIMQYQSGEYVRRDDESDIRVNPAGATGSPFEGAN